MPGSVPEHGPHPRLTTTQPNRDKTVMPAAVPLLSPTHPRATSPSTPWDPEPDAPSGLAPLPRRLSSSLTQKGFLRRLWSPRWHSGQAEGSLDICDDALGQASVAQLSGSLGQVDREEGADAGRQARMKY